MPAQFLWLHLPGMALILALFAYFVFNRGRHELAVREGALLVALYALYLGGNAALALWGGE